MYVYCTSMIIDHEENSLTCKTSISSNRAHMRKGLSIGTSWSFSGGMRSTCRDNNTFVFGRLCSFACFRFTRTDLSFLSISLHQKSVELIIPSKSLDFQLYFHSILFEAVDESYIFRLCASENESHQLSFTSNITAPSVRTPRRYAHDNMFPLSIRGA